jgi:hypothetical protein
MQRAAQHSTGRLELPDDHPPAPSCAGACFFCLSHRRRRRRRRRRRETMRTISCAQMTNEYIFQQHQTWGRDFEALFKPYGLRGGAAVQHAVLQQCNMLRCNI